MKVGAKEDELFVEMKFDHMEENILADLLDSTRPKEKKKTPEEFRTPHLFLCESFKAINNEKSEAEKAILARKRLEEEESGMIMRGTYKSRFLNQKLEEQAEAKRKEKLMRKKLRKQGKKVEEKKSEGGPVKDRKKKGGLQVYLQEIEELEEEIESLSEKERVLQRDLDTRSGDYEEQLKEKEAVIGKLNEAKRQMWHMKEEINYHKVVNEVERRRRAAEEHEAKEEGAKKVKHVKVE